MDFHIKFVRLYKKIIEHAIKLEDKERVFGYNVSNVRIDEFYFFRRSSQFSIKMMNKEIIFKTGLNAEQIYFPMFILADIINKDTFGFDISPLPFMYFEHLNDIGEVDDMGLYYDGVKMTDKMYFMNKMLNEKADFWIQYSGNSDLTMKKLVFDFIDSNINQYIFEDGEYIKNSFVGSKVIRFRETKKWIKDDNELMYYYLKSGGIFDLNKDLIEYTLGDILEHLDRQIFIFENSEKFEKINEEVILQTKNPKMIQKYLTMGVEIEDALGFVGF